MNRLGLLERTKRSFAIDRINYKLSALAKAQMKDISELKPVKILQAKYGNVISFTKSGKISKKSDLYGDLINYLENVQSLAQRKQSEHLQGVSGGTLAEHLNVNDELIEALESSKDFQYDEMLAEGILQTGTNPLDLSVEDKRALIAEINDLRESRSPITGEELSGGITFE